MAFRTTGLDPDEFRPFFAMGDEDLARLGVRRYIADKPIGFPDRISLQDATPGDRVLLLNYVYQPAPTPYRGTHAIYVNEASNAPFDAANEIPSSFRPRLLSLRAFDADHMMIDADIIEGTDVETLITQLFDNDRVVYLQAHYAKRGCFAARIDRA